MPKHDSDDQGENEAVPDILDEDIVIKTMYEGIQNFTSMNEAEKPEELLVDLFKYQRQGLFWLSRQEEGAYRGGILADDMGLGKTVQCIALMLKNRPKNPDRKTTLIVGPVAVLRQWKSELEAKAGKRTFKILVHHGEDRVKSAKKFMDYDVV